jgi:hypothetical protein
MDWITTLESLAINVLGGLATVYGLSRYLGLIWLERQKAAYGKEFEEFKNALERDKQRIQAEIDRSVFVTRAQFDTEFTAMKDVFSLLSETLLTINGVRPMTEIVSDNMSIEERRSQVLSTIGELQTASNDLITRATALCPFYPADLFDCVRECHSTATLEARLARTGLHVQGHEFSHEWRKSGEANQKEFKAAYDRAASIIRSRIERLAVLPPR